VLACHDAGIAALLSRGFVLDRSSAADSAGRPYGTGSQGQHRYLCRSAGERAGRKSVDGVGDAHVDWTKSKHMPIQRLTRCGMIAPGQIRDAGALSTGIPLCAACGPNLLRPNLLSCPWGSGRRAACFHTMTVSPRVASPQARHPIGLMSEMRSERDAAAAQWRDALGREAQDFRQINSLRRTDRARRASISPVPWRQSGW
jgi:hypothetical protein